MPAKFKSLPRERARAVMWIIGAEQQPVRCYLKGDASHSVDFPKTKMNNNTTTTTSIRSSSSSSSRERAV